MIVKKIPTIQGKVYSKGPYDRRFEGLREGTGQQTVIHKGCIEGKKSVKTLIEERSWNRVKLTSFDVGLPDGVLSSILRDRMKCWKWLTYECWIA